jgi:DHA1 family tetracycline resistance protein-like MFS transporter
MHARFSATYPQLWPLLMAVFTCCFGISLILPFLPLLEVVYHVGAFTMGFLISSNAIFGFVASMVFGKASDLFGRRPCMLLAQAGVLAGFVILAFSTTIWLVLIARIVDGAFSGQLAIANAVVADMVLPKDRSKEMTTIGTVATFAFIFGPAIGGFLYQWHGISGVGILAVFVATCNLVLTAARFPESHPDRVSAKPAWMLIQAEPGQASTIATTTVPETALESLAPAQKARRLNYVLVLFLVMDLAEFIFEATMTLFMFFLVGWSSTEIGFVFTAMAVFQVVFRVLFFNAILKKLGDTMTIMLGLAIYVADFLLMGIRAGPWFLLGLLLLITLATVFTRGILIGFASRLTAASSQGKVMGAATSLDYLAQIVGPFIGTYLLLDQTIPVYLISLEVLSLGTLAMGAGLFKFGSDARKKKTLENPEP